MVRAFSPVIPGARLDAQIVIEIVQVNRSGFAESHFRRDFAIAIADALTMFFEKLSELGLRYAEM